jgi:hypothetical protein
MVFYVDGEGVLHAFDLTSNIDRDGDNSSDDGEIRDSSQGAPYDEVWQVSLGEFASSPTAAYVPIGGLAVPAVFVTKQSGSVVGYAINDYYNPGPPPITYHAPTEISVLSGMTAFASATDISAPTYVDGTIYVGDGDGRLWAKKLTGGFWCSPMASTPISVPLPAIGSPIVGSVRDSATGAVDHMVYLPRMGAAAGSSGDGGIDCLPIRVFNEPLQRGSQSPPNSWTFRTRSNGQIKNPGWSLWYVDTTLPGDSLKLIPTTSVIFSPPSSFTVDFSSSSIPPGSTIVADYELDPLTSPGITSRCTIKAKPDPDVATTTTGVGCTPALSQKDILYFFSTSSGKPSSLYAAQETGHGQTRARVKWRWYLGDYLVNTTWPASLFGGVAAQPVGSPAVARDMVYFGVNSGNNGYLLAFRADPGFSLSLSPDRPIDPSKPVILQQIDAMNPDPVNPMTITCGGAEDSGAHIDYNSGKIIINDFRSGRDASKDFSVSNSVTVSFYCEDDPNMVTQIHEAFGLNPVNKDDRWNNLAWFVDLGVRIASSPMVMGDILYVGLDNIPGGVNLAAMDVEKSRAHINGDLSVTWNPPANPDWQWAEKVMGGVGPIMSTVCGANGVLAIAAPNGLAVYHNPITLIADGNRLVKIDSGGRMVWSCDATTGYVGAQVMGGAQTYGAVTKPFSRPAVAREALAGGIIVADTGNNRIVHIDTGGRILWEITDFLDNGPVDLTGIQGLPLLPPGSSLSLSGPMDVSMWTQQDARLAYAGFPEYHYLIADSGNFRVVEVVARCYDTATGAYQNELQWTTKTHLQGHQYRYVSARRVPQVDIATGTWSTVTMCAISNLSANPGNPEGPGGVLVKIDDAGLIAQIRITVDMMGAVTQPLYNPTFFDRVLKSPTEYSDIVVDAAGIYMVSYDTTKAPPNDVIAFRSYTAKQYFAPPAPYVQGKPLSVAYAQLMPNGNVIVANKATGAAGGNAFFGEVFELVPDAGGASYDYRPLKPVAGGTGANIYEPRQPSSAERLPY